MFPDHRSATPARYSLPAILLHWTIAAAIVFQIAVGLGLEALGPKAFAQYQLHKSIGIAILLLTLLRLGLRLFARRPPPLEAGWQGRLAALVHGGLYAFMLGAPITGWMLVSSAKVRVPTLLFGRAHWPHLPVPEGWNPAVAEAHELVAWLGIALILLHVAGAIRHHVLLRDGLVYRMTPARSLILALGLSALLPLAWVAGRASLTQPPRPSASASSAPTPMAPVPAKPQATAPAASKAPEAPPVESSRPQAAASAESVLPGPPPAWTILPGGRLNFTARYGDDGYKGSFARWSGRILFDPAHPESADISIKVDMTSASMGDPTQDSMLPGADLFDTARYASAMFTASRARATGPGSYRMRGRLTIKGRTAPQELTFSLSGDGATRHVTGSAVIDRTMFAVGTGGDLSGIAPTVALDFAFDARSQGN